MDNDNKKQKPDRRGVPLLRFSLRLGSVKSCRQSMTRIIREYSKGNIVDADYRALLWGLSQVIHYWKFERDIQIEQKIDEIREVLQDRGLL